MRRRVALYVVLLLAVLAFCSLRAHGQDLAAAPPATLGDWWQWAAGILSAVVLLGGAWGVVVKVQDRAAQRRDEARAALVGPLEQAVATLGGKVDALRREVADMRADLYPREEPGPLAHRRAVDARIAAVEAAVATLTGEKRTEVDALVRRLAEALGSQS